MEGVKKKQVHKVVLLGDGGVGKTSLLKRYLGKGFQETYKMTLGAEFSIKRWGNDIIQIWDLGGQEVFSQVRKTYYTGSIGAFVLFDVTNRKSFKNVIRWVEELIINTGYQVPVMIIGNKIDLKKDDYKNYVDIKEAIDLCKKIMETFNCPVTYCGTSAKEGLYIDGIFEDFISWTKSSDIHNDMNQTEVTIIHNQYKKDEEFENFQSNENDNSTEDSQSKEIKSDDSTLEEKSFEVPEPEKKSNFPESINENSDNSEKEISEKQEMM